MQMLDPGNMMVKYRWLLSRSLPSTEGNQASSGRPAMHMASATCNRNKYRVLMEAEERLLNPVMRNET